MQDRSTLWKELAAGGAFSLESVAEIGGVQYASISAPVINRALFSDALSVGNCVSATLQFSLLTSDTIPKSAKIVIQQRLTNSAKHSEWLPAGTFFVSKRTSDAVTGLLTFQCYDSMLKANAPYPLTDASEAEFPKPMTDCIMVIAARMGVEVDPRTWDHIQTGFEYVIPMPIGLTMIKVLGYIAGVHGGNWIITPENKLRFVPLISSAGADAAPVGERVDVFGIMGKLNTGDTLTVSGVSMRKGDDTFTAGDETGFVVKVGINPYATQWICDRLHAELNGLVYNPYSIEKGVYDPAAELGDYVASKDDVRSILYAETVTLNLAFRGDLSSPFKAEMEDEYPYTSTTAELADELRELITVVADKASIEDLYAVYAMIENLSVSDIKTGIIHSNDYEIRTIPLVYPESGLYPSDSTFPSNGETVLKGFAIDFSTGVIYGAFYSEQIAALQEEVDEINSWKEGVAGEFREELDEQAQDLSGLHSTVDGQGQAINTLQQLAGLQGAAITQIGEQIAAIQQSMSDLQNNIIKLQNSLTYPKSDPAAVSPEPAPESLN